MFCLISYLGEVTYTVLPVFICGQCNLRCFACFLVWAKQLHCFACFLVWAKQLHCSACFLVWAEQLTQFCQFSCVGEATYTVLPVFLCGRSNYTVSPVFLCRQSNLHYFACYLVWAEELTLFCWFSCVRRATYNVLPVFCVGSLESNYTVLPASLCGRSNCTFLWAEQLTLFCRFSYVRRATYAVLPVFMCGRSNLHCFACFSWAKQLTLFCLFSRVGGAQLQTSDTCKSFSDSDNYSYTVLACFHMWAEQLTLFCLFSWAEQLTLFCLFSRVGGVQLQTSDACKSFSDSDNYSYTVLPVSICGQGKLHCFVCFHMLVRNNLHCFAFFHVWAVQNTVLLVFMGRATYTVLPVFMCGRSSTPNF